MESGTIKNILIIGLISTNAILFIILSTYHTQHDQEPILSSVKNVIIPQKQHYNPKEFNLKNLKGLSKQQLDQHISLYIGYVNKRNEITNALTTVDRTTVANRTYSPFRSLKLAETYAVNGALLHELYFENMSQTTSSVGPEMHKLIEYSFGSFDAFKKDFIDCAQCSRGWVITAYQIDDGLLHNFVLEEHNQHVPVLSIPLLVLDVYEHAYMIDYGIKRNPYIEVFWQLIDWNILEKRINQWVNPLKS